MKTCTNCQTQFTISDEDKAFLNKFTFQINANSFQIPEPTFCPACRQQRRLTFRNERSLYRRKCDLSGKSIISIYKEDSPYKVYSSEEWWSDKWSALNYGRDYDFNRPFFEQFAELHHAVPHLALHVTNSENSDYTNLSGYNNNCHLIFASEYNEDCLYGTQVIKSKNCLDTVNCIQSSYCYDVTDVQDCYQVLYSQDCKNCTESMFLFNCNNCNNCLFSSNLRNQQYYIYNKKHTKEEYEATRDQLLNQLSQGQLNTLKEQFQTYKYNSIHKNVSLTNCENTLGNFLNNCKNTQICFDLDNGEDCRYVYTGYQVKDLMDVCHTTEMELCYEGLSVGYKSYNVLFANGAWSSSNAYYVDNVHSCQNVFGCSNLRNKQYCILNKQYTKEEYEALLPRIIEHMKSTGEWGQFFPSSLSPFAYEDSAANDYYPLTNKVTKYQGEIPADSIICEVSGRPFKLMPSEKSFYTSLKLPTPTRHPDQRHKERMNMRPPRVLSNRICDKCKTPTITPFTKELAQTVYCEKCYLETLY